MTKTNKPMGFVTMEDVQGNIELVLFPRTWQKTHDLLKVGQIIIVEGKADTGSTPPKILVDEIRTEIKILEPLNAPPKPTAPTATFTDEPEGEPGPVLPLEQHPRQNASFQKKAPVKPSVPPPTRQAAEQPAAYVDPEPASPLGNAENDWGEMPPPPDNFPDDWNSEWQPSFEQATIAARPDVERKPEPKPAVSEPPRQSESIEAEIRPNAPTNVAVVREPRETPAIQPVGPVQIPPTDFLPSLYIPLAQEDKDKDHPPQQITVVLRSTGDNERDKRRIKTIYGTLISFHGRDRFSFQIFENGKGHLIDFPNDTTRVCTEVLDRLKKLMGEESWRVEEITFQ
jgi:DNA polymerase-3 subunit alpha